MINEQHSWERKEGDTPKSWVAFKLYRDMGLTRSLSKVAKDFPKPSAKLRQLHTWSAQGKWVQRCAEFDAYQDEILMKENEAELKKMGKRHATLSMMLQKKGLDKFKSIKEKDAKDLSVNDALKLTTEGMKFERLSRGESTESIEIQTGTDVIKQKMRDAYEKSRRKLGPSNDGSGNANNP